MALIDTINQLKESNTSKNGVFSKNNPKISSRFKNLGKLLSRSGINDVQNKISNNTIVDKVSRITSDDSKLMTNSIYSSDKSINDNSISKNIVKNNISKSSPIYSPSFSPIRLAPSPDITKVNNNKVSNTNNTNKVSNTNNTNKISNTNNTNNTNNKSQNSSFTTPTKNNISVGSNIEKTFKFDEKNNDNQFVLEELKKQTKIQSDILVELRKNKDTDKGLLDFLDDFKKNKKTPPVKGGGLLSKAKDVITKTKDGLKSLGEKTLTKLGGLADKSKNVIKTTANIAKNAATKGLTSGALQTGARVLGAVAAPLAAASTGYMVGDAIGTEIYNKYQDTDFMKGVGATVAKVGAFFGNKEAQDAVAINSKEKDLSKEQLNEKAKANKNALIEEMNASGITDQKERAMVLANAHHETGGFKKTVEGKYSADKVWEMRGATLSKKGVTLEKLKSEEKSGGKDAMYEYMYGDAYRDKGYKMGNTEKGDAAKYKGRGLYQLTGKSNYAEASKAIGVDLVKNPELAEDPKIAAKIAMWHWKKSGGGEKARKGDIVGSRKAVNGGSIGIDDVSANYQAYLKTDTYKTEVVKNNISPDSKVASSSVTKDPKIDANTESAIISTSNANNKNSPDSKVASNTKPQSDNNKVASFNTSSTNKTKIDTIISEPTKKETNIIPNTKIETMSNNYIGEPTVSEVATNKPKENITNMVASAQPMTSGSVRQTTIPSNAQQSKSDEVSPNIEVRKQTSTIQRVFDRDASLMI